MSYNYIRVETNNNFLVLFSCYDPQINTKRQMTTDKGPLAQLVEPLTFNQLVGRSNRPRPTMLFASNL